MKKYSIVCYYTLVCEKFKYELIKKISREYNVNVFI